MPKNKSFSQLAKNIEKRYSDFEKKLAVETSNVVQSMVNYLVVETPVDTSKALSNWQVSITTKISSDINPYFEGIAGSTFGSSSNAAMDNARNVLSGKRTQGIVYLSNVTDYVAKLNRGSSKQSAGGFFEAAFALGQNKAKNIKIKF